MSSSRSVEAVVVSTDQPDYDGGAAIQEYEVLMTNPDNTTRNVYAGRDQECAVAGLLPGRPYLFQVRPTNKAGVSLTLSQLICQMLVCLFNPLMAPLYVRGVYKCGIHTTMALAFRYILTVLSTSKGQSFSFTMTLTSSM